VQYGIFYCFYSTDGTNFYASNTGACPSTGSFGTVNLSGPNNGNVYNAINGFSGPSTGVNWPSTLSGQFINYVNTGGSIANTQYAQQCQCPLARSAKLQAIQRKDKKAEDKKTVSKK